MNKRLAYLGLFSAVAMILGYVDTLLPVFPVPGIKLGLANLAVILALYFYGPKEALLVSSVRILTLGFLFGNLFSIVYSFCGAVLSLGVMTLLKKVNRFSLVTVSIAGGISHNLGQLAAASQIVENFHLFYYFPVYFMAGFLTGLAIGVAADQVKRRIGVEK